MKTMTMTMTTGNTKSDIASDCFEVQRYYDINPSSFFMIHKEGVHCELCHDADHLGQSTEVDGKVYDVCCAIEWAVERITNPPYHKKPTAP